MGKLTLIGADIHIFLGILMPYKVNTYMKVDHCTTVTKWLWVVRRASLLPVFLACIHSLSGTYFTVIILHYAVMTNYIHTKSLFAFFLGRLLYANSIPFRPTYYLAFLCKNKCSIVEERMCKKVPLTNSPLTPPFNFRLRLLRLKA